MLLPLADSLLAVLGYAPAAEQRLHHLALLQRSPLVPKPALPLDGPAKPSIDAAPAPPAPAPAAERTPFAPSTPVVTGRAAAEHVAYALSDVSFVFSAGSRAHLGQSAKAWAAEGRANVYGRDGRVLDLETREGALSVLDGVLSENPGAKTSAFAASPALLPMIPALYRAAAQRHATVVHVGAQATDPQTLETQTSHADVYAARHTGWAILASQTAQEAHDMALAAHLAAQALQQPVLHVVDHQIADIETRVALLGPGELGELVASAGTAPGESLDAVFEQMAPAVGRRYRFFEYAGPADAQHVVVAMGSDAAAIRDILQLVFADNKIGVLAVRVYRPWSARAFASALPKTATRVSVLERGATDALLQDVVASVQSQRSPAPLVVGGRVVGDELTASMVWSVADNLTRDAPRTGFAVGSGAAADEALATGPEMAVSSGDARQCLIWDQEHGDAVMRTAAALLGENPHVQVHARSTTQAHGATDAPATMSVVRVARANTPAAAQLGGPADFVAVHQAALLDAFSVVGKVRPGGAVLINAEWADEAQASEALPAAFKAAAARKGVEIAVVNARKAATKAGADPDTVAQAVLVASFLRLSGASVHSAEASWAYLRYLDGHGLADVDLDKALQAATFVVPIGASWQAAAGDDAAGAVLPSGLADVATAAAKAAPTASGRSQAIWRMLFPESFSTHQRTRPEEHVAYEITVTENRRLTPSDYSRNVFHLEFDTAGTGLKYEIGDALAVFGHNDAREVGDFLAFYGLEPDTVVSVPRDKEAGAGFAESRTLEQVFTQVVDIFGRPSKRFYATLATHARDPSERARLEHLASKEGKDEFKQRADATVTFADLLREFPSAHPSVAELLQMVPGIKARHYSIASSMKMHADSVHLLVVAVEWETPSGVPRFGQCTRYLVGLRAGDKVSVAIKPSVMRLPPSPEAPVIMAGLGTGMAPFRAFIEERAALRRDGHKVGPMVLYFGSRSRFQEYLYGEELEAYHADGLLTRLQLAFSRDQKDKVYIQHKITEDKALLYDLLEQQGGAFYLCGPTWPVPDVTEALSSGYTTKGGLSAEEAAKALAELKEQERFVLEVY